MNFDLTASATNEIPSRPGYGSRLRISTVALAIFIVYVLGAHLRLSLYSGGSVLVPMYLMLISAAALVVLYFKKIFFRAGVFLFALASFVLIQPILAMGITADYTDHILGCLQLISSIVAALAVCYTLQNIPKRRLRRVLITLWVTFVSLAVLESVGLRPLFEPIREALYAGSDRFVYTAVERDVSIYGKVRPTVFASEPSYFADTISILMLMIFILDPRRGSIPSWIKLFGMIVVSFLVSPSFKMVFYIMALGVWQFWPTTRKNLFTVLLALFVIGIVGVVFYGPIAAGLDRVFGTHLVSGSFYGRIGVAPVVGFGALEAAPVFGFGIGNEDGVYPMIARAWSESGAFFRFPWYRELTASHLMSNGFWWQLIFLGGVGTAIFSLLVVGAFRQIGVRMPLRALVATWIVWYAGSAFVDPFSWYVMVAFSVGTMKYRTSGVRQPPARKVAPHE